MCLVFDCQQCFYANSCFSPTFYDVFGEETLHVSVLLIPAVSVVLELEIHGGVRLKVGDKNVRKF